MRNFFLINLIRPIYHYFRRKYNTYLHIQKAKDLKYIKYKNEPQRIFYLGVTEHSNLGDNAQFYCIRRWIKDNFPKIPCYEFESTTVCDPKANFVSILKEIIKPDDLIIFQSGYTTQDLGGNHDLMHRMICEAIPEIKILMMPQTIFFKEKENRLRTSRAYNKARNMLFLARDEVSFSMANEMFPDIKVMLFPDIVTSLIGTLNFNNKRRGVCLCTRNDTEKYYSYEEIDNFRKRLDENGEYVFQKDTSASQKQKQIRENQKRIIENEIEVFSNFEITITDRYHGTIFSLCAGTPVIILKTNDHKVVTGADWFKGIYDDYVYVAKNLDDAYNIYKELKKKKFSHKLEPYFQENYYSKLISYIK